MSEEAAAREPAPPSTPAAPTTPAAPAAPAAAARPAWTPPDTFSEKFSRASTRAVQYAFAAFGLLSLILLIVWVVPAVVVARSDSYRIAKESVVSNASLIQRIGEPITCDRVPDHYRMGTPEGDVFRFEFEGPRAMGEIELTIKDGQVAAGARYFIWPKF